MNANYWNTVNEGGEGYVHQAPEKRSTAQIECELLGAEDELKSAKINAAYKDGQDGTAYKVERLQKKVAALKAEMSGAAPATVAVSAPATAPKNTAQAGKTWFYVSGRFTRAQLIAKREKAEHAAKIGGETFGAEARAVVAAITKLIGE